MKRQMLDAEKLIAQAMLKVKRHEDGTGHHQRVADTALSLMNAWAGALSPVEGDDEGAALRRQMLGTFLAGYQAAVLTQLTGCDHGQHDEAMEQLMALVTKQATSKATRARVEPIEKRREALREAWASGEHFSRDRCAYALWGRLGFPSERAAREALNNTPDPTSNAWAGGRKRVNG